MDIKRLHIKSIRSIENEDVYDITVAKNHNFFGNGVLVHNCAEISLYGKTEGGESGFQFCNLSEINGGKCIDYATLEKAARAASILGTLQAGYTNFKYMSPSTKEITEREALIGVSITGWMNNPDILFDVDNMQNAATIAKETNKKVAEILGINQAARVTTTKPSGNACTSIDTKIRTELGIMTMLEVFSHITENSIDINDIKPGDFVVPEVPLKVFDDGNTLRDITAFYINGLAETFDITFADGKTYSFTGEHKLKVVGTGWKYVRDLTELDSIESFE